MVEYLVVATAERHTYDYDALGRRILKVVDADGLGPGSPIETRYFYDGRQVCEEQDAAGATLATYVYGLYIDEVLTMERGGSDFYYHTDDLYNVMALTDGAGDVVERYEYGDYGRPTIMDADGGNVSCTFDVDGDGQVGAFDLANLLGCWGPISPGVCTSLDVDNSGNIDAFDLANLLGGWGKCPTPGSAIGNAYMFTGRRWDPETGWFYYRTRYLDPDAGRFTTRDTIGIWKDSANLGNAFVYAATNPFSALDPFGLFSCSPPTARCHRGAKGTTTSTTCTRKCCIHASYGFLPSPRGGLPKIVEICQVWGRQNCTTNWICRIGLVGRRCQYGWHTKGKYFIRQLHTSCGPCRRDWRNPNIA